VTQLERQRQEYHWRQEQDQKLLNDVRNSLTFLPFVSLTLPKMKRQLSDAHSSEMQLRAEARRFEEECTRLRKDADRQSAKVNTAATGNTTREMDLEQKYEKCMVSPVIGPLYPQYLTLRRNFSDAPHANKVSGHMC
jgi:hypothetical protein